MRGGTPLHPHRELGKVAGTVDLDLEVGCEAVHLEHFGLDLRWEHIDAPHDQHVVGAAGDALDAPHGTGRAGQQPGEIAGAVADHGLPPLGQCREHQVTELAVGQRLSRAGIDDLGVEVVLPQRGAVFGLDALLGHARSHHLRQPVDVDGVDAEARLDLSPELVGPRLSTEDAHLQ